MIRTPLPLVPEVECLKSNNPSSTAKEKDLQNKLTLALATIIGQQNRIDSLEGEIDTLRADNKAATSII